MPYNREVVMKRWDWIKFLGIELDSVGVEVMKDSFPWKDVDACLGNEAEPPIEGLLPLINRKMLAEIAVSDFDHFESIVKKVNS